MSVVLSIEDVGPWKKELKVEIPEPAVEAEMSRVTREYSRQVRLPGFRKGKVPASVVRKRFAEDIERETVERLVPRYWEQAKAEKSLDPMTSPRVEKVDLEPGSPMIFTATVEVRPEFELDASREFELPEEVTTPTDLEIDEVVERIRADVAPWKAIDRASATGDRVKLRLREQSEADGEQDAGADEQDGPQETDAEVAETDGYQEVEVEVDDERVWEELRVAVTGMEAGHTGQFTRTHEVAHSHEGEGEEHDESVEPHTHSHHYEFEILEVQEKELPAVDDELAKQVGDFESLEELRTNIRERLAHDKASTLHQKRETALLDQLRQRNPFDLPEGAVDAEIDNLLRDYAGNLMQRGVDIENAGIDWQSMRDQARPQAEANVHARLLLDALADAESVEVEPSEIDQRIQMLARYENKSAHSLRHELSQDGRIDALRRSVRREKTVARLLGEETDTGSDDEQDSDDGDASSES